MKCRFNAKRALQNGVSLLAPYGTRVSSVEAFLPFPLASTIHTAPGGGRYAMRKTTIIWHNSNRQNVARGNWQTGAGGRHYFKSMPVTEQWQGRARANTYPFIGERNRCSMHRSFWVWCWVPVEAPSLALLATADAPVYHANQTDDIRPINSIDAVSPCAKWWHIVCEWLARC